MIEDVADWGAGDLEVGLRATFEREIYQEDILTFSNLSWDRNPLHVDPEYASTTQFSKPIVHGAFSASNGIGFCGYVSTRAASSPDVDEQQVHLTFVLPQ